MAYEPKKLKPAHLAMLRLFWQGESIADIAVATSYSAQQVSQIVNSEHAKQILDEMTADTLDTMAQVQTEAQLAAPILWDELYNLARNAGEERTRFNALRECLHIAGHVPARRISFERANSVDEKYKGFSEEELRQQLVGDIATDAPPTSGNGPDGKPLQ